MQSRVKVWAKAAIIIPGCYLWARKPFLPRGPELMDTALSQNPCLSTSRGWSSPFLN